MGVKRGECNIGLECKGIISCGQWWDYKRKSLLFVNMFLEIHTAYRFIHHPQYTTSSCPKYHHHFILRTRFHIVLLLLFGLHPSKISSPLGTPRDCQVFWYPDLESQTLTVLKPTRSKTRKQEGSGKSRHCWIRFVPGNCVAVF
jgi:hypothetical protein